MRRQLSAFCFFFAACACGCEPSAPLIAESDELMVYVVLESSPSDFAPQPITAVVARSATPAVEFLSAHVFSMRRASDGRLFDWREQPTISIGIGQLSGNYVLAEALSDVGALGRDSLMPGDRYDLWVETRGRTITGSVTLPGRPVLRLHRGVELDTIMWAPVAGAAAYRTPDGRLSADTMWIGNRQSAGTRYFVTAVDPQLAQYLRSPRLAQSGVAGSLGLFGGQVTVSLKVPPDGAASAASSGSASATHLTEESAATSSHLQNEAAFHRQILLSSRCLATAGLLERGGSKAEREAGVKRESICLASVKGDSHSLQLWSKGGVYGPL